MSSVQCLREFMNERLTAAAEEIFRVFQKTIVHYEEEIDRQRRLLDIVLKPEIKLHRTEVCKEEPCDQERNSSLDREEPEPPQIKEEQDELYTSLEGEQLVLKQETETFMLTLTCEESDNSEEQTLNLCPDESQSAADKEHVVSMSMKSSVVPKPNSDDQLLSHNSPVAESQDHEGGKQGDSESTRNTELKPQKRHHKSKSSSDNICNTTMLKTQLDTQTGKQVCDTCGEAFKYVSQLNRHLKIHSSEKPYPCNTCGERFSEITNMKKHMTTHAREKPYPCNTCEKRFADQSARKRHMRVHTGEKPFPCNTCGKRFSQLVVLKKHMRIHTGEKPYSCNTCESRFSQLGTLQSHMRIHTGEKPYSCNTCEKSFSQQSTLKLHTRVHTGEKPYNCKTCGKDFMHRHQLKTHMRTHTVGKDSFRCQT